MYTAQRLSGETEKPGAPPTEAVGSQVVTGVEVYLLKGQVLQS